MARIMRQDRQSGARLAERDRQTLAQLKAAGSNLNAPHDVENFLYFPNETKAREATAGLRPRGYLANTQPSSGATSRLVGAGCQAACSNRSSNRSNAKRHAIDSQNLFRRVRWLGQQSRSVKSRTKGTELLSAQRVVSSVLERHRLEWHGPQKL